VTWSAPQSAGLLASAWPFQSPDRALWGAEGAVVENAIVTASFPQGSINPANSTAPQGGIGFVDYRPAQTSGCLTYELRFQPGFAFNRGGKLPGLFGGSEYSGCTGSTSQGFSTRMMWGRNGTFFLYAYFADRTTECGEVQGSGVAYANPGQWHRIEQRIRLNTPGQRDGAITVLVDGQMIAALTEREITSGPLIDGLAFHTFFGGSSPADASPRAQAIDFRTFRFALP